MQHRSHASAFAELQWEHLSSVQNKTVKHAVKLRTSTSYRSETGRLLLAGATVLMEQFNNRGHARQPPEVRASPHMPRSHLMDSNPVFVQDSILYHRL